MLGGTLLVVGALEYDISGEVDLTDNEETLASDGIFHNLLSEGLPLEVNTPVSVAFKWTRVNISF